MGPSWWLARIIILTLSGGLDSLRASAKAAALHSVARVATTIAGPACVKRAQIQRTVAPAGLHQCPLTRGSKISPSERRRSPRSVTQDHTSRLGEAPARERVPPGSDERQRTSPPGALQARRPEPGWRLGSTSQRAFRRCNRTLAPTRRAYVVACRASSAARRRGQTTPFATLIGFHWPASRVLSLPTRANYNSWGPSVKLGGAAASAPPHPTPCRLTCRPHPPSASLLGHNERG